MILELLVGKLQLLLWYESPQEIEWSEQCQSNFIVSSIFTLNLVYLCSVFLEMWSNFDIVVTIQFLEVLRATIAFVISLRATLISIFLDFPNADSAVFTFSITFSHAFLFLTSLKPNKFVARFNFLCVYQSM